MSSLGVRDGQKFRIMDFSFSCELYIFAKFSVQSKYE